jgi:hypothetical protein
MDPPGVERIAGDDHAFTKERRDGKGREGCYGKGANDEGREWQPEDDGLRAAFEVSE